MGMRMFRMNLFNSPPKLDVKGWVRGLLSVGKSSSPKVRGSVLIVANAEGGSSNDMYKALELRRLLGGEGDVAVKGDIGMVSIYGDRNGYSNLIAGRARVMAERQCALPLTIVTMGDNAVFRDAAQAATVLAEEGIKAEVVPGPDEGAGVPSDIAKLPRFIATATRLPMFGMVVFDDNAPNPFSHGETIGSGLWRMCADIDAHYMPEPVTVVIDRRSDILMDQGLVLPPISLRETARSVTGFIIDTARQIGHSVVESGYETYQKNLGTKVG